MHERTLGRDENFEALGTTEEWEEWDGTGGAIKSDAEWEDSDNPGGPTSFNERIFQRVALKPKLVSWHSMLTVQIHQAQNPESHQPHTPNSARPSSAHTTKRNMLRKELSESLRKDLFWERQDKKSTSNAVLKRRHAAVETEIPQNTTSEVHANFYHHKTW